MNDGCEPAPVPARGWGNEGSPGQARQLSCIPRQWMGVLCHRNEPTSRGSRWQRHWQAPAAQPWPCRAPACLGSHGLAWDGPTLVYVLPTPPPPQPGHSIRCRWQFPWQPQDAASELSVEQGVLLSKGYKNICLKRMSGTWVLISLNSKSTQNKRDRNTVWGEKMPEVRLRTTSLGQVQKNNNLAQRKTIFSVVQYQPPPGWAAHSPQDLLPQPCRYLSPGWPLQLNPWPLLSPGGECCPHHHCAEDCPCQASCPIKHVIWVCFDSAAHL